MSETVSSSSMAYRAVVVAIAGLERELLVPFMRYAYLTCELLGRDLDSRLLIAAHLLKRDVSCFVGQQWSMFANLKTAPKGTFLFKTANKVQAEAALVAKRHGHKVVMSDEEVLAVSTEAQIRHLLNPLSAEIADVFLCLDDRHRRIVSSLGKTQCAVVGSARVDLLARHKDIYAKEVDSIRAKGPYILFNTSFGTINSLWGTVDHAMGIIANATGMNPEQTSANAKNIVSFEAASRAATLELIEWLSSKFDRRIIVRPHPAENTDTWSSIPGIEVAKKTNPIPWLMGAEIMIHSNSTTGLEGAVLGTPCLNVVMIDNPETDMYVTQCNYTSRSVEDAKAALQQFLAGKTGPLSEAYKTDFPTDGAQRCAEVIAGICFESRTLMQWGALARKVTQIEKFSIKVHEFAARATAICKSAGVENISVLQVDNSCFLLSRP